MLSSWTVLLLASTASGAAICASLVSRRRPAILSAILSGLLTSSAVYSVAAIVRWTAQVGIGIAAGSIGVGALLGGFGLAAALVPPLTRLSSRRPERSAGGDGGPAVIIVADGQPEHYEPATTTQSFERLAESGVPLPPIAMRVFAYLSDRSRYAAAGISPARPVVRAVSARAAAIIVRSGFKGEVLEAWLHGTPRLSDAIATAVERGSGRIAIVLLDVAESYEYDLALRELGTPECNTTGLSIACSPPLWSEDPLARIVCAKVHSAFPGGPTQTDGVVLVAEGQPPTWDRTHPRATEHRTFFCQRVRSMLLDNGFADAHVRTAWLDWQDPDVTEVVRHLAAIGCDRIAVVPATSVADTLEVALDMPAAVAAAAVESSVKVDVLHGWGDEEAVAEAVARHALRTLEELDGRPERDDQ